METAVLDVLGGEMTAMQVAERLGRKTPRAVVPALNSLRAQNRVQRRIDAGPTGEGSPVARWSAI